MAYSSTTDALSHLTDFSSFEALCCDLLSSYGNYHGIIPQGIGRIDNGKDAIHISRDTYSVCVVKNTTVFHFSVRADYKTKIRQDLNSVKKNSHKWSTSPDHFLFVTNQSISSIERDELEKKLSHEFHLLVTIYEREWIRFPLDNDYQALRKKYLHIDYDKSIFSPLDDVLSNIYRHPNINDLESNNYIPRKETCEEIFKILDRDSVCLLQAPPGSGKTGIAKITGYMFQKKSVQNVAYIISARTEDSYHKWIEHIRTFDRTYALFIIDDVHLAVESGNQFIAHIHVIKNAKILLVTRPLSRLMRGPSTESYIDLLSEQEVNCRLTDNDIYSFIELKWKLKTGSILSGNQFDTLKDIAKGDLHLLDYYINSYSEETKCIDYENFYADIWTRYIDKNEACLKTFLKVTILSQYELPIATEHLEDIGCAAVLKSNVWVDSHVRARDNSRVEYLMFFHSTAARLFVQSAYHLGKIPDGDIYRYSENIMLGYLKQYPSNFSKTTKHWIDEDGVEVVRKIFNDSEVLTTFFSYYVQKNGIRTGQDLYEISSTFLILSSIQGEKAYQYFSQNLEKLLNFFSIKEWSEMFSPLRLDQIVTISVTYYLCNKNFLNIFKSIVSYDLVNKKADNYSFYFVLNEIRNSKSRPLEVKEFLIDTLFKIDLEKLILSNDKPSFSRFKKIVFLLSDIQLPVRYINRYAREINFPSYGKEMTGKSISVIRPVIQFAKQAGFAPEIIAEFIENCNLANIGRTNPAPPFNNLKNFINDAHIAGVSDQYLISLTDQLNWEKIGNEYFERPSPGAAIFLITFLLHSRSISKEHVKMFLNGFGWKNLQGAIENYYSADAISALRVLLFKKAELTINDLKKLNVDLRPSRIWRNSFLNRPIPIVNEKQQKMLLPHLARAEYGLRNVIKKNPEAFFSNISLKQWNIFLRNIGIINQDLVTEFAIPVLSIITPEKLDRLISESDLKNIGIFLNMISQTIPDRTMFLSPKLKLNLVDFENKIFDSELVSISHFLFSFFYINRPDKSCEFALQLEDLVDKIIPTFYKASVREIDFFLWNYWMSLPENHLPSLFYNEDVLNCINSAFKSPKNLRERAGIVGTIVLSTGRKFEIGQRDLESARGITNKLLDDASIDSIRVLAGMIGSGLKDLMRHNYLELSNLIDSFNNDYSIGNHSIAIQKVQMMLRDVAKR